MMVDLKTLTHRDQFGHFLNAYARHGTGVEVGVAYAENAQKWLAVWTAGTLLLVDPYAQQDKSAYRDTTGRMNMEAAFEHAKDRLMGFGDRKKFIREFSVPAAAGIQDESLDFAYIDGAHDYTNVTADLAAWWPKVRPGGIFGGHDFYWLDTPDDLCEVPRAVSEFAAAKVVPIWFTVCSSWWCIKP